MKEGVHEWSAPFPNNVDNNRAARKIRQGRDRHLGGGLDTKQGLRECEASQIAYDGSILPSSRRQRMEEKRIGKKAIFRDEDAQKRIEREQQKDKGDNPSLLAPNARLGQKGKSISEYAARNNNEDERKKGNAYGPV